MAANRPALHRKFVKPAFAAALLWLVVTSVSAQQGKTVIGPSNAPLYEGSQALIAGDAKEGVRLTLIGLIRATDSLERRTAKSNLCAGYTLLENYATALEYCNEVLIDDDTYWRAYSNRALIYIRLRRFDEAERDLLKGEAINANSRTLKALRKMYLDATQPVAPSVVIDDRQGAENETGSAE